MALVLTRKPGEAIIIKTPLGDRRIYVVSIEGNVVRLSFEAPQDVEIIREELLLDDAKGQREWDRQQDRRQPPPDRRRA